MLRSSRRLSCRRSSGSIPCVHVKRPARVRRTLMAAASSRSFVARASAAALPCARSCFSSLLTWRRLPRSSASRCVGQGGQESPKPQKRSLGALLRASKVQLSPSMQSMELWSAQCTHRATRRAPHLRCTLFCCACSRLCCLACLRLLARLVPLRRQLARQVSPVALQLEGAGRHAVPQGISSFLCLCSTLLGLQGSGPTWFACLRNGCRGDARKMVRRRCR